MANTTPLIPSHPPPSNCDPVKASKAIVPGDKISFPTTTPQRTSKAPIWWTNAIFFVGVHIVAIYGAIWVSPLHKVSISNLILCWAYCQLGTFGITIGYHRLWSHKAFQAIEPFRWFLAFAASFGFQGSVRWWVLRHRLHHRWTDSEHDPYCAKRGLLFSHMGWIFRKPRYEKLKLIDRSDLDRDPVVNFQHAYYIPISIFVGFVLPHLLSTYVFKSNTHSSWDGLIWGGFVSRLIIWHLTFFINSLAHYVGDQLFDLDITARSNFLLALFTCGEANHNYHHVFPKDYRNGPATLDWDPTKWIIYLLHTYTPLIPKIYCTPTAEIERARKRVLRMTQPTQRSTCSKPQPGWFPSFEDLFRLQSPSTHETEHEASTSSDGTISAHSDGQFTFLSSSTSESDAEDRLRVVRRQVWSRHEIHQHIWDHLHRQHVDEAESEPIIRKKLKQLIILLIDGYLLDLTAYASSGNHPGGIKILRDHSILQTSLPPRDRSSSSHRIKAEFEALGLEVVLKDSTRAFYFELNQHSWPAKQKMKSFRIAKLI